MEDMLIGSERGVVDGPPPTEGGESDGLRLMSPEVRPDVSIWMGW